MTTGLLGVLGSKAGAKVFGSKTQVTVIPAPGAHEAHPDRDEFTTHFAEGPNAIPVKLMICAPTRPP